MKKLLLVCGLFGFMLGITFSGCDQLMNPEETDDATLVEEVKAFISAEDSLFSLDDLNDSSEENLLADYDGLGRVAPIGMRRKVSEATREVDVNLIADDSALVTITHQVAGSLFVGVDTSATDDVRQIDTIWVKPFEISTSRKAIVVKRDFPDSLESLQRMGGRHEGWRLASMTPVVGGTTGSDLSITQVQIINVTREDTLTVTDPLNNLMTWREPPYFLRGDSVVVDVDVTNMDQSGERVVLHYPARLLTRKIVRNMPAENGHMRTWRIRRSAGMWRVTVDVIDHDLLTDPAAAYNAVFWRLPAFIFPLRMADRIY